MASAGADFESQEEVLQIIAESWNEVNKRPEERNGGSSLNKGGDAAASGKDLKATDGYQEAAPKPVVKKEVETKKSGGFFSRFSGGGKKTDSKGQSVGDAGDAGSSSAKGDGNKFDVPETFDEMVKLNAAMTGANPAYIFIMLDGFAEIVRDVCKYGQLQEQTDILAMRIAKDVKGSIKTSEFKVCMLASMRSLIPAMWNTRYEQAWLWLWDSIDVQLKESLLLPPKYEKPVDRFVTSLERQERRDIGMAVWTRMFKIDPEAERVFNQSNERLMFIVEKALEFSGTIYQEPTKMNSAIGSLGLRHIMFGAKPENFQLFCQMMEEELNSRSVDPLVVAGIIWSLKVIACIMARTVEEGSTPILVAALANNPKKLKAVLQQQPRGTRSKAMLSAQHCAPDPTAKKGKGAVIEAVDGTAMSAEVAAE